MAESFLVISTAIRGVVVGIFDLESNGSVIWRTQSAHFDGHAATASLAAMVEQSLAMVSYRLSDLKSILVDVGPGSFTGIKVGLAFIKGLATGDRDRRLSIIGVSALEAMAVDPEKTWVLPSNRAQGFMGYWQQQPRIGVMDTVGDQLQVMGEVDKVPLTNHPLGLRPTVLLNHWPAFERLAVQKQIGFSVAEEPQLAGWILHYMTAAFIKQRASYEQQLDVQPRYVRESAPQEKLTRK